NVITTVKTMLLSDDERGVMWFGRLKTLDDDKTRDLMKTPAMTFAYSATPGGMVDQIKEVYADVFPDWRKPDRDDEEGWAQIYREWNYLAQKIFRACEAVMPGPARTMRYIRKLAEHCWQDGRVLEWVSPSGFPVSNRYHEPDVHEVSMKRLADPEN